MLRSKTLVLGALVASLAGCGGGRAGAGAETGGTKTPTNPGSKKTSAGMVVDRGAQSAFEEALKLFVDTDKKGNWSSCQDVANDFLGAAKQQKAATNQRFAEAIYNAGLAYQRCNRDSDAQKLFSEAVAANPNFHRARGAFDIARGAGGRLVSRSPPGRKTRPTE